jgi:UDP-2,3-diacylglucosamine pyrophosphatase LpxH
MKTETRIFSIVVSVIAALVVAGFFLWIFSLQSTKGLPAWGDGWSTNFKAVGFLGVLPLIIALIGLFWLKRPDSRLGTGIGIAAIALAGLVVVGTVIGIGEISLRSKALTKPLPQLNLVDPGKGIALRGPADAEGNPVLRLALSSDPHWGAATSNPAARASIMKSIDAESPARDAFFILGDNVELGINEAYWREEAADLKANLVNTPLRPILGNHDGLINGQYHFVKYFFPDKFTTDSGSRFYYSIDAGPARIFVIDLLWGPEEFDATQKAWFEKALAATPRDKQIIVLSHCFVSASGYVEPSTGKAWYDHAENLALIAPILEKYKVSLMVSGHNHFMEYLERNGVAYAIVGAMGGKPDPKRVYVSPSSKWYLSDVFGYLDLDASAKGIALTFRDSEGKSLYEALVPPVAR